MAIRIPIVVINGYPQEIPVGDKIENCTETKTFEFTTPVTEVTCAHNLDKFPVITVIDSLGKEIQCYKEYVDSNTIKIEFDKPRIGKVLIN